MHREDPLPLRLYTRALVILLRRFRESYGAGMAAMLADEWRERRGPGRGALLAGALVDLLWTAVVERIGGTGRRSRGEAGMALRGEFGLSWLDFKVGFRMLIRYPGLTVVGGLTMAFAIAVGVGLFQLITLMEHPALPLPDGERIVGLGYWDRAANDQAPTTAYDVIRWREALTTVEAIGGFRSLRRNLGAGAGVGAPVTVAEVNAAGFRVAGVPPLLGRTLVQADEETGAAPVVVLGHGLWKTRFGGDPGVVGSVVRLGEVAATVVGVMPEGFAFPVDHELWTPLRLGDVPEGAGQGPSLQVFGRLATGAGISQARAEVRAVADRMAADFPARYEHLVPEVRPYAESILGNFSAGNALLRASIYSINLLPALFLILVCGNVALLMFARAATRERELVVRTALGASRRRIVSQLFAEALVLGTLATSLGLLAARLGLHWGLAEVYGESRPFWVVGDLSPATMIYAGLLTILAAVVTGVVPALKATGRGTGARLRQATAGGGGLRMGGVWTGMIVVQVAATVVFTAVAYLVHRQAVELTPQAMGFEPEQYLAVQIGAEPGTPLVGDTSLEAIRQRYTAITDELIRRLDADPAVASVTVADGLPLLDQRVGVVEVDGEADPTPGVAEVEYTDPRRPRYFIMTTSVAIDFFDVFRAPILSGRGFDSRDFTQHANTVVVNQSFVDRLFDGRSPIGRRIRYGVAPGEQPGPWYEIVGVVRNLVMDRTNALVLDQEVRAQVYHPLSPGRVRYPLQLGVRAGGDPDATAPSIRRIAAEVSPALRLDIQNLERARIEDAKFWTFCSDVILLATAIALFLALAGTYSVMSFTVSQRTREIGIRVALGARASGIVAEIFRRPLRLVAAGVISGCALVAGLMVFLLGVLGLGESVVPAQAAALFLAFGLAVLAVCAVACIGPTRRALRVQPAVALNGEV